jgi:signal transduction histidine kinase
MQQIALIWYRLTNPFCEVREPQQRRQARLLTALLLALLVMAFSIVASLTLVTPSGLLHFPGFRYGALAAALLALAYGLSRSRYYSLAAGFTVGALSAATFVLAVSPPARLNFLAFLVIPLLLSSIFLSFRTTVALVILHFIALLALPAMVATVSFNQLIVGPILYTGLVSVLILVVTYYRNLLERDRNSSLTELVDARTGELTRANRELEVEVRVRQWAQEALLQSEARNWAILDAIPDPMLRVATDGTIRDFKPSTNRSPIQFVLPEEMVGKNVGDIFAARVGQQLISSVRQAIATGGVLLLEHRFSGTIDGEIRIVASGSDEALCIVRDITERKQMEAGLRRSLEKEQHLGEMKLRFFSMVSHEFRSPLTTILSSSELLLHYHERMSEERKLKHHHTIQSQVKRLTELLDDVMLLSKAEGGKLEFNPAPLALEEFCDEIVEQVKLSATDAHQIVFTPKGDFTRAVMDAKLLRHILTNLLSNAVKYSPQGGVVRLDLTGGDGQVEFRVQDQGIGIPEDDQPQLFQVFYRASNVDNIAGTGLGLAITRRAVDLHQGIIHFESRVGVGTRFTVKVPLCPKVPGRPGDGQAEEAAFA